MSKSTVTTNTSIVKVSSPTVPPRIIENFIIIWLDSAIDESNQDTTNSITQLQQIVNSILTFDDPDQCVTFITNITDEKVFLIISGSLGQTLISLIENITQIDSIYVFCNDKTKHDSWAQQYQKVKGVFTQIEHICDALKQDVRQSETNLTPISIVSNASSTNLNELDQSFMYSLLLKEILLEFEHDEKAKKEMIDFCRQQYADNARELRIIDEFERQYEHPSPIWWYTRECFTYSMLNRALRTLDVEVILKMGVFIRDLHRQIEQIHSQSSGQHSFIVYRGQGMMNEEFDKMKKSRGCLLSFNNFLSTSMVKEVSMRFARRIRTNPDMTAILFRVKINPSISSTPFAPLDKISYYSDREKEVLFSMHTVFRIGEIKEMEDRLWQVDLTLTNDNDQQLTQLTEHMRKMTVAPTGIFRLGQLMIQMGELNKAEEIFVLVLDTTSNDSRDTLALVHHQLGFITKEKGNLSNALYHYKKSLGIKMTYLSSEDDRLASTYSNIGGILTQQGDLDDALKYYQRALNISLHALQPDQLAIATLHNNIGSVLSDQGKYTEAIISYEQALETKLRYLPPRHPSLAITYGNIGGLHCLMKNYPMGLSFYEKTLDTQQKSLPSNHPSLAITYHNIARIYEGLNQYKEAVEYAKQALNISRRVFGSDHPEVKRRQDYLDAFHQKL